MNHIVDNKDTTTEEDIKLQWHTAFCSAMRLELMEDSDRLEFYEEYLLGTKPMQIDLLVDVIEVKGNEPIHNEIGKYFRRLNIFEYKSPGDSLGRLEYFDVIAYANRFIAVPGIGYNAKPDDVSISLVRNEKPVELMKMLTDEDGCTIENPYPGIYHVTGHHHFRLQIIVSRLLDEKNHGWLTALTRQLTENKLKVLLERMDNVRDGEYKNYSHSVLDIAINANRELFDRLYKEGKGMIEGLRRYYNLDRVGDIISIARDFNASDEYIVSEIMKKLSCDEDTAWNYLKKYESGVVMA